MADFLVIGALALDRPVRLSGPLEPGGRLLGTSLDGALAGRLGGGAANAGVALARAGHHVAVGGVVAADADGDACLALVRAAGLDTRHVIRRDGVSRTTLILIEPGGERLVLGLDVEPAKPPTLPPPKPDAAFDGLYVRAPYPGAEAWAAACTGPVVAHWPAGGFTGPCDVLVASMDDCDAATLADPFAAGRAQVGERLSWMVLTRGGHGVTAHDGRRVLRATPRLATVVDATGAGDCFAAGLLEALTAGADMQAALAHGCAWGTVAVGLDASAPLDGVFPAFRPAAS
ncbi:PfkB family carbohydrate kinase [Phenylobacterium sp.]|uniref:PfkB family carbohydrate kinase n=1 Tax=Phenylobacterium sp. TaxID=1871053 RepID=UPI0027156D7D|nr:PfkB family carbohydrate kinase [Phenylobacterium sp.]MDO8802348.1 PfkB family carbohydrate kinase [Phenylobacterium sp.]